MAMAMAGTSVLRLEPSYPLQREHQRRAHQREVREPIQRRRSRRVHIDAIQICMQLIRMLAVLCFAVGVQDDARLERARGERERWVGVGRCTEGGDGVGRRRLRALRGDSGRIEGSGHRRRRHEVLRVCFGGLFGHGRGRIRLAYINEKEKNPSAIAQGNGQNRIAHFRTEWPVRGVNPPSAHQSPSQ